MLYTVENQVDLERFIVKVLSDPLEDGGAESFTITWSDLGTILKTAEPGPLSLWARSFAEQAKVHPSETPDAVSFIRLMPKAIIE